jgi:hypothetical protein
MDMTGLKRVGGSPAIVVAVLALTAAAVGTALADSGPTARPSAKVDKALKVAKKALRIARAADKEVGPAGPKGDDGAKGDKGDPGATDVVFMQQSGGSVAADSSDDQVVNCPSGTVATGGGVRLSSANADDLSDFHITRNSAETTVNGEAPTSWRGDVYNHDENGDNDSVSWIVSVICASP